MKGVAIMLLAAPLTSGCARDSGGVQVLESEIQADDSGHFAFSLENTSAHDVAVDEVSASCSCTTFDGVPSLVPGGKMVTVRGRVDLSRAPESVGISVLVEHSLLRRRLHVIRREPEWDRGVIYRTGVRPDTVLHAVARVYLNGDRTQCLARLSALIVDAPGVIRGHWGPLCPVEDKANRWCADLDLQVAKNLGADTISGRVSLEGVPLRIALVPVEEDETGDGKEHHMPPGERKNG